MPFGTFLDSFPAAMFIAAHIAFLFVALWAVKTASDGGLAHAPAFWLYAASQVGFLAVFAGSLTLKAGVLLEQTLLVVAVIWITVATTRKLRPATT